MLPWEYRYHQVLSQVIDDALPLLERDPRNWKELEIAALLFFAYQGYSVRMPMTLRGARGSHKIDVLATFSKGGIEYKIIIECKCWRQRVKKEQVAALVSIMEDVGASKAIIISKSGFQEGALKYARGRSVELMNLQKIMQRIRHESLDALLEHFSGDLSDLEEELNKEKFGEYYYTADFKAKMELVTKGVVTNYYDRFLEEVARLREIRDHLWWELATGPMKFPRTYTQFFPVKRKKQVNSWSDFSACVLSDYSYLIQEYRHLKKQCQNLRYVV